MLVNEISDRVYDTLVSRIKTNFFTCHVLFSLGNDRISKPCLVNRIRSGRFVKTGDFEGTINGSNNAAIIATINGTVEGTLNGTICKIEFNVLR